MMTISRADMPWASALSTSDSWFACCENWATISVSTSAAVVRESTRYVDGIQEALDVPAGPCRQVEAVG